VYKRQALIYARSKEEADQIALKIDTVSRYPDKSKKHVVVSYSEGTYGLNDLVLYSTIVSRIYDYDKLFQMKGRLDRPGQNADTLYIKFFLVKNTIEEANIIKLEMGNNFYSNYIMPLAEFYDLALKKLI